MGSARDGRNILLVEDDPDHAELTRRALQGEHTVFWVKDGEEALDFLGHRREPFDLASAPRPALIVLDLNLPKINGLEVLRRIKHDDDLCTIPVVILSTSDRDEEVMVGYRAGANSFVTKPVSFREFRERVVSLKDYWLHTNGTLRA